jgi:hypothetical protein
LQQQVIALRARVAGIGDPMPNEKPPHYEAVTPSPWPPRRRSQRSRRARRGRRTWARAR